MEAGDYALTWTNYGSSALSQAFRLESQATAPLLALNSPAAFDGTRLFAVSLTAGQTIGLKSSGYTEWRLLSALGEVEEYIYSDPYSFSTLNSPTSGTYFLELNYVEDPGNGISFEFVSERVLTQALAAGVSVSASGNELTTNRFTFDVSQPSTWLFDLHAVSNLQDALHWRLEKDGVEIDGGYLMEFWEWTDNGQLPGNPVMQLGVGNYAFSIQGAASYQLKRVALEDAPLLSLSSVNTAVLLNGEAAVYQLDAEAGQELVYVTAIQTDETGDTPSIAGRWRLMDAEGFVIHESEYLDEMSVFSFSEGGRYWLVLEPTPIEVASDWPLTYQFEVVLAPLGGRQLPGLGQVVEEAWSEDGVLTFAFNLDQAALLYLDDQLNNIDWMTLESGGGEVFPIDGSRLYSVPAGLCILTLYGDPSSESVLFQLIDILAETP
ncbi:MAG: hypothetical protein Q8K34_14595, partial [Hydrogenophaga sp.]|nr:hypothetical protein [Hydrogenophaga sp.]